MKCLITGAGGFLGSYLAEHLLDQGQEVVAATRTVNGALASLRDRLATIAVDLLDQEALRALVRDVKPEVVFHLAAQSQPRASWQDPETTFRVNLHGTLYLLDAIRSAGLDPVIQVMGSSAEYASDPATNSCIREDHPLAPSSPYALSKIAANHLCLLYGRAHGTRILRVRPFFVIGPRKLGDAASDFARAIVAVERGERQHIEVGNVQAIRDFVDVRDAVAALWLLVLRGRPGEVYNLCSGVGRPVGELLNLMRSWARAPVEVRSRPDSLRPLDEPIRVGDGRRLMESGWKPAVPIEQTLAEILDYWRADAAAAGECAKRPKNRPEGS